MKFIFCGGIIFLCLFWVFPDICISLESAEVLVISNENNPKSVSLAAYYIQKRKIPAKNILTIRTTDTETCTRFDYENNIALPVRKYFEANRAESRIRCLALMYGLPLKILPDDKGSPDQTASLDSEISLVLAGNYPLSGRLPNPFFVGFRKKKPGIDKNRVLMVSRLDGPTEATVKRIIDDSIGAEQKGLNGNAYFDARWPDPGTRNVSGYALYDRSIHLAAKRIRESSRMPVTLNEREALFQPGDCPDAALYCGWYSLAEYVDAFKWNPGSIGYHIASAECVTLKKKSSRVWCKRMLEEGVAVTLGPVAEPYVNAFPLPEVFFSLLIDGYLTVAECYLASLPYLSWQMVLIGDPLYRPFQAYLKHKFRKDYQDGNVQ